MHEWSTGIAYRVEILQNQVLEAHAHLQWNVTVDNTL